jgi:hypothetical protein
MANIAERVKALQLPLDQIVVIGSGLLDVLGLRDSGDVDLVVTTELFDELRATELYDEEEKYGDTVLLKDDLEIWRDWSKELPFATLQQSAVIINDIQFVNPKILIEMKRRRGSEKDLHDIQLLEGYYDNRK